LDITLVNYLQAPRCDLDNNRTNGKQHNTNNSSLVFHTLNDRIRIAEQVKEEKRISSTLNYSCSSDLLLD